MTFMDLARPAALSRLRPSLMQRLAVWRTRRALAALDARALADVGLTQDDAAAEAAKGVWDVPSTWINR